MTNFARGLATALTVLLFTSLAQAEFPFGKSAITGGLSMQQDGPAIGIEFEHAKDRTYGIGGQLRIYPADEEKGYTGGYLLGGFIRPHFNRQAWDFYVSPGFALGNIKFMGDDGKKDDETMFGPSLNYGLVYELTPTFALGLDHANFWGWFGEDELRKLLVNDVMVSGRFIF